MIVIVGKPNCQRCDMAKQLCRTKEVQFEYKEVFKELNKMEVNDEVIAWYQGKKYVYKVTDKKIVQPNEVSVLQPTSSEQITLMTCWPVGTTKERLIIIAKPAQ